jgi:integrase
MSRQPFLLKARRGIWYYKLPDEASYHTTHIKHTRKADRDIAAAWVLDLISRPSPLDPFLRDFADGFFRWPDASYIKRQLAKGRPFGKAHADIRQGYLDHHILPAFGRRRLSTLTKSELESWVIGLDLANATKNHILYTLRTVLQEAVDAGALAASPLVRMEPLGVVFRARDVFSVADYRALFPPNDLAKVWGSQRKGLFFLILAGTGIRSGECRALSWRQVLWEDRALLIDRTCIGGSLEIGPVSEKKGGAKIVLMPLRVHDELKGWQELALQREAEDLVFPGRARGQPISKATITHALPVALWRLNKEAKEKKLPPVIDTRGRNLVTHSFRHTFNSRLRRLVSEDILRSLTGHHSEAMTNLYDHPNIADRIALIEPARSIIDKLFD